MLQDNNNRTPLHRAAKRGRTEICSLLLKALLLWPRVTTRSLSECQKTFLATLWCFKQFNITKDPEIKILSYLDDFLLVLTCAYYRKDIIPQRYSSLVDNMLIPHINENIESTKTVMRQVLAQVYTEGLEALLNPNTLSDRVIEILSNED